jgi:peptide-methionine (S)-S-oxide reductase
MNRTGQIEGRRVGLAKTLWRWAGKDYLWLCAALIVGVALYSSGNLAAETAFKIPPPEADITEAAPGNTRTAVFAGGCFWGVQAVFQHTKGVIQAVSGYAGGKAETATYDKVTTDTTGHAESVQVTFDPALISYGQLLQIYFSVIHDPTQLNRQGPDVGTHYRSAVFHVDDAQKQVAEKYIAQLDAAQVYRKKIVTQLTPLDGFYPAEGYHQDYATLHPESGYIIAFDLPKIANLKAMFPQWYRAEPQLVNPKNARLAPRA